MRRIVWTALLGLVLVSATATGVAAQDFTVGYQFGHFSQDIVSGNAPAGIYIDGNFPVSKNGLSVFGEMNWAHGTTIHIEGFGDQSVTSDSITVVGGARWTAVKVAMKPFVQAGFGVVHSSNDAPFSEPANDPAFGVDGGVAFPMGMSKVSIVALFGWARVFSDADIDPNVTRFVVGARIRLGH